MKFTLTKDADAVTQTHGFVHVMGDKDNRLMQLCLDALEFCLQHLTADRV